MALATDPDRISTLLQHIRAGCDVNKSCTVARIPRSSYYRWLEVASDARTDTPPEEWTDHQRDCVEFADSLELAKAQSVTSLELVVAQAAREDWRAAVTMLKKHENGSWSGQPKVELVGPQGGPIQVEVAPGPDMTDPQVAREVWAARAEMGDPQAIKVMKALDE